MQPTTKTFQYSNEKLLQVRIFKMLRLWVGLFCAQRNDCCPSASSISMAVSLKHLSDLPLNQPDPNLSAHVILSWENCSAHLIYLVYKYRLIKGAGLAVSVAYHFLVVLMIYGAWKVVNTISWIITRPTIIIKRRPIERRPLNLRRLCGNQNQRGSSRRGRTRRRRTRRSSDAYGCKSDHEDSKKMLRVHLAPCGRRGAVDDWSNGWSG